MPYGFGPFFPFRRNNRKPDGTWDAPDATDENIKGTSVDPLQPMWPRWKQTPPPHGEGEFVSDQPFFDIDEIRQKAELYPPGRALVDKNVGGHPASRQRVGDMPGGNLWRRRLLVGRAQEGESYPESSEYGGQMAANAPALQLAGTAPSQSRPAPRAPAAPQTDFNDNDVDLLARLIFAEAAGQFRAPGAYLGVGSTILNRIKAPGFPKTLQDVVLERTPSGIPQFAGVGSPLWNRASNPSALTGENATAYRAAQAVARDLLYGTTDYDLVDPTAGATYFYSSRTNTPPQGFFTGRINSGRLQKTYEAGRPRYGISSRSSAIPNHNGRGRQNSGALFGQCATTP